MEGKIIVVTSGKGGVGKTTVVANIGIGLAQAGRKVVLIDADIGLRNLDIVLGLENRIVYDIVDIIEGNCKLKQALIRDKKINNLHLLPAAQTKDKEDISPEQLKNIAEELSREFDYIIIDSPAGIDRGFKNAVFCAKDAIVVVTPEVASIRDADRVIGLLETYEILEPKLIINRTRPEMMKKGNMLTVEDIIDILNIKVLGVIPDDNKVVIATNKGEGIILHSKSKAGIEYQNIIKRLEGEDIPFIEINSDKWIDKIRNFFKNFTGKKK